MEKFESGYDNIVRVRSEKEKQQAREFFEEMYNSPISGRYKKFELEKNQEDKDTINAALNAVRCFLESEYGIELKSYSPSKIFILQSGSIYNVTGGVLKTGTCTPMAQNVYVERIGSKIVMASIIIHELLHNFSFKSGQVISEGDFAPYRNGVKMYDIHNGISYMEDLHEAIVAKLSKKIVVENLMKQELFSGDVAKIEIVKQWLKKNSEPELEKTFGEDLEEIYYIDGIDELIKIIQDESLDDRHKKMRIKEFMVNNEVYKTERHEERIELDELIKGIRDKSAKSEEEVFKVIAQANFDGKLLAFAHMVEKYLGAGEFKRRFGKDSV